MCPLESAAEKRSVRRLRPQRLYTVTAQSERNPMEKPDGNRQPAAPLTKVRIEANLEETRERIAQAAARAGRDPNQVRLVAVTKTVGVSEVQILADLGLTDLAENRVAAAGAKVQAMRGRVRWHMVGPVQRRKARDVVDLFDCVDSVDRVELAEALNKRCAEAGKILPILMEANVSGEPTKHGFTSEELSRAVEQVTELPHLRLDGLMTMAPYATDPEETRPVFASLRELARRLGLAELSMGMSNDFEVAIEEGATQVRIGTALFS